jgi:hypothetical protein
MDSNKTSFSSDSFTTFLISENQTKNFDGIISANLSSVEYGEFIQKFISKFDTTQKISRTFSKNRKFSWSCKIFFIKDKSELPPNS